MATGDLASRNSGGPMDLLSQLLTTFKGSATTTQTTSETVSDAKAQEYLRSILAGPNGLAAVSGRQKAAGLYNSTVNQQLTNDLLARATAQTAALSSTKTTSASTGRQANPYTSILSLLGGQALGKITAPVLTAAKKKLGLNGADDTLTSWGNDISDAIFGGGGGGSGFAINNTAQIGDVYPAAFDRMGINSGALQDVSDITQVSSGAGSTAALGGLGAAGAGFASGLLGGGGSAAAATGLTNGSYAIALDSGATGLFGAGTAAGAGEAIGSIGGGLAAAEGAGSIGAGIGAGAAEGLGAGAAAAGGGLGLAASAGVLGAFALAANYLQSKNSFSFADLIANAAKSTGAPTEES